MNLALLRSLLQIDCSELYTSEISINTPLQITELNASLYEYSKLGPVHIAKNQISMSPHQKIQLAILAARRGHSIEDISALIHWKDFEDLVVMLLTQHGYSVLKHHRFKSHGKRHEIDVLAFKEPLALAIECKQWKRSWQKAVTKRIVNKQLERSVALSASWQDLSLRSHNHIIPQWKHLIILPLILTLYLTPFKSYKKVPVIPIFYFNNFLGTELDKHFTEFQTYNVHRC